MVRVANSDRTDIGRKSDAYQSDLRSDSDHGTSHIVWRCGSCQQLIQQGNLPVRLEHDVVVHEAPEKCPWCGATRNFQLIDED